MARSAARTAFLSDVLICAIEHNGYGFPGLVSSDLDFDREPMMTQALIVDRYEEEGQAPVRIDLDTIAAGIGVIRNAVDQDIKDEMILHNAKTLQRLHLSHGARKDILECSRENDASEIDVVYALAILECGLFGAVTYC